MKLVDDTYAGLGARIIASDATIVSVRKSATLTGSTRALAKKICQTTTMTKTMTVQLRAAPSVLVSPKRCSATARKPRVAATRAALLVRRAEAPTADVDGTSRS
jgi:hypothetical protein